MKTPAGNKRGHRPWECVTDISPASGGKCSGCDAEIPAFSGVTQSIEAELRELVARGEPVSAIRRLRDVSGASLAECKLWVAHSWSQEWRPAGPPCANCGARLRTPRAKLCAECGTRISG